MGLGCWGFWGAAATWGGLLTQKSGSIGDGPEGDTDHGRQHGHEFHLCAYSSAYFLI